MSFKIICPVCLEQTIAPVTFSCGHTICYSCENQLHKRICPECRTDIPDVCNVNIALDEILSNTIPGYLDKKKIIIEKASSIIRIKNYTNSTRYEYLTDIITGHFEINGHSLFDTILQLCKNTFDVEPTSDELLFVLNNMPVIEIEISISITREIESSCDTITEPITNEIKTYYIDYDNELNLKNFVRLYKDKISHEDKYKILTCVDEDIQELARCLDIDVNLDIKYNAAEFNNHINKLSLIKKEDSDIEEDF